MLLSTGRFFGQAAGGATAPAQFQTGDWSVADDETGGDITITITTLPSDGGSAITDLEYQIDGGSWISLGGTTTGDYPVSGLTDDVEVDVAIRAINAIGAGTASATKAVTPTTGSALDFSFVGQNSGTSGTLAVNFGAEDADRYIIASIGCVESNANGRNVTAVSIGGVAATLVTRQPAVSGPTIASIWIAAVPTGTSGNVVVTHTGFNRFSVACYRAVGLGSASPHDTDGSNGADVTLDIPAGGVAVGIGCKWLDTALTLKNMTSDYNVSPGTNARCAHESNVTGGGTSITCGMDQGGGSARGMSVASFA